MLMVQYTTYQQRQMYLEQRIQIMLKDVLNDRLTCVIYKPYTAPA
jgi:hypothetical protein